MHHGLEMNTTRFIRRATQSEPPVDVSLGDVQRFWNDHPCDSHTSQAPRHDRAFFEDVAAERYRKEWHIPSMARFEQFAGRRVLEIGCGLGTDGAQFAAHGARYTGVDLTAESTGLTRRHLRFRNLPGQVAQTNAESLPFADESFDHVYSYGVIHHSPNTEQIAREMHRVLKAGGTMCVMIYHQNSVNYWFEIMFLRRLLRYCLRPTWAPSFFARLTGFDGDKLARQRERFLSPAARDPARWVSMNTDGPECPLAKVYTRASAGRLFEMFADVRCRAYFFDKSHYPLIGRLIPRALESALGRAWGWHLVVTGRKAGDAS